MKLETVRTVLIAMKAGRLPQECVERSERTVCALERLRRREEDDLGEERARTALPLLQDLPYIGP